MIWSINYYIYSNDKKRDIDKMKIALLRHGRPAFNDNEKITAENFSQWIDSYNASGLSAQYQPSKQAIDIASQCNKVVCSDLPRSIDSAYVLGIDQIDDIDSLFREMDLPHACFPSPKLSPNLWLVLLRISWFLGYSGKVESFQQAKIRASKAANKLQEITFSDESVILIGHGMLNRFIGKALVSSGWKKTKHFSANQYWGFTVYDRG